jgi:hypothetical protein
LNEDNERKHTKNIKTRRRRLVQFITEVILGTRAQIMCVKNIWVDEAF